MEFPTLQFRPLQPEDWPAVSAIYQQGIDTGNATFAEQPPASWEEWSRSKLAECRLVVNRSGAVAGWAALSPVSSRPVYRGVAELSLYISASVRGQGVGAALLQEVIRCSEMQGFWTLEALIFPENTGSMHLHQKYGFKLLGIREKMGYMTFGPYAGCWRDVALLERRSQVTGIGVA